jgi:hypothetical protein
VIDNLEVKFHLFGEIVGNVFSINSLRVYYLLEDLEKDVEKTL